MHRYATPLLLCFLFCAATATAQQPAAQQQAAAQAAAAAIKQQAAGLKSQFGFSDAQVKQFIARQTTIYSAWNKQSGDLRKKMMAEKDKTKRKEFMEKMRAGLTQRDTQVQAALRAVATPEQRKKMM
ncbi:MAG: hypothetical protein H7145_11630 [Akkermansiaceae bacterium]|nr:hypothetical protein [Armatimonadota bacterium]